MTDPMAATPGWVDGRLDEITAKLPGAAKPAVDALAACLAGSKQPAAPSDMLGAEFNRCHASFRTALQHLQLEPALLDDVLADLEALEAEIAADS